MLVNPYLLSLEILENTGLLQEGLMFLILAGDQPGKTLKQIIICKRLSV